MNKNKLFNTEKTLVRDVMLIKADGTLEEFTEDHEKILYLILKYSHTARDKTEKDKWIRELPLLALIHYGILKKALDFDYAPASVELEIGRKFFNISQEGLDIIEDLREFGFIDCLKLSSTSHLFVAGYKINHEGLKIVHGLHGKLKVSDDVKKQIDKLILCPNCESIIEVDVKIIPETKDVAVDMVCSIPSCEFREPIGMEQLEDVSYVSEPYLPRYSRRLA